MADTLKSIVGGPWVIEELTGSGTWTNPGNITGGMVWITGCGGGGGGGFRNVSLLGGGGGGGGACAVEHLMIVGTDNQSYAVGAGGTGGATGGNNDGTNGGNTRFGVITLGGGRAGLSSSAGGQGGSVWTGTTGPQTDSWPGGNGGGADAQGQDGIPYSASGQIFTHIASGAGGGGGVSGGTYGQAGGNAYSPGGQTTNSTDDAGGGGGSLGTGGYRDNNTNVLPSWGGGGSGGEPGGSHAGQNGGAGKLFVRYQQGS